MRHRIREVGREGVHHLSRSTAIDGVSATFQSRKIEGRTDGATGADWITLPSNGTAEQEFLAALIEHMGGTPIADRP